MSKVLASLLCGLSLWALAPANAYSQHYYVSPLGNDSNPGTQLRPWQTIEKVNAADFGPGDGVHFQAGQRFAGAIELDRSDSGTSGRKFTVTSYGKGRATIDAGNGSGLKANGCDHLVVKDLIFVGSGRKAGNTEDGVLVVDSQGTNIDGIEISGFRGSGLRLDGARDARITNVYAHENGSAGITVGHDKLSTHLRIDHCVADNNPGDPANLTNHSGNGIVVGNAGDVVIEYCEASNNGWDMPRKGNGPVGIWAWNADRVAIQFCISHGNKSPGDDGGGFDLDGGVTNSVLQYNLSYNNDGPGYFLCQYPGAPVFKNNVIRYNISQNDGARIFQVGGKVTNAKIYNNVIFVAEGKGDPLMIWHSKDGLWPDNIHYHNNIFYNLGKGGFNLGESTSIAFDYNVFYGHHDPTEPADPHKLTQDPKLVKPGTGSVGRDTVDGYRLLADSPCIDSGMTVANDGERDYWGNPVPSGRGTDRGANERGK